ncbi:hypothetical protein [Alloscardovia criceti]|uniref:hypothetical protein n=1 Tax=Alloscardovia criceti TaxID=356828 RepID=UPI0012EA1295|nr:hypothetical protein [Alloscardovia criceti]
MSTYVRRNQVVSVMRDYGCGTSVMVNRYTRVDLNDSARCCDKGSTAYNETVVALGGDCFDPMTCCDQQERDMIAAIRDCLRPKSAPESLYSRLKDCIDCMCDEA